MSSRRYPDRELRDRAKVVCVLCHARKVKCDLAFQRNGMCHNCQKHGLKCERRVGRRPILREKYASSQLPGSPNSALPSKQKSSSDIRTRGPGISYFDFSRFQCREVDGNDQTLCHPPYLEEVPIVTNPPPAPPHQYQSILNFAEGINKQLIQMTGATIMPSRIMVQAYFDAYHQHLFHRIPVLNREDVFGDEPSVLVCQALCLAGSLLRHPQAESPLVDYGQLFIRIKTLLYVNYETNYLMVLKALCLLLTWNIGGSLVVTFDCSWHWLGQASRLLTQMLLFRESTYTELAKRGHNPGEARRIAWCIFVQDKLMAAAYGRPSVIKSYEYDVRPLTPEDFETQDTKARLFIEWTKLGTILGQMLDYQKRQTSHPIAKRCNTTDSLKEWIHCLPEELRLYNQSGNKVYRRDVYEIHVLYFVVLITTLCTRGQNERSTTAGVAALVASSCICALFEEMIYRDDINYLGGISNWFLMMAAVPQLQQEAVIGHGEDPLCSKELDVIVAAAKELKIKFAVGSTAVLGAIDKLREQGQHPARVINDAGRQTHELSNLHDFFPFPTLIAPRMALLDGERDNFILEHAISLPFGEELGWIFNEFTELPCNLSVADGYNFLPQHC